MTFDATGRRRVIGAAFLLAALAMLIGGETVLKGHLGPLGFLLLWLGCLACTLAAIVLAFRDFRALQQRVYNDQRELFEVTLKNIETDARSRKDGQKAASGNGAGDQSPRERRL